MVDQPIYRERGARLKQAMIMRGHGKATALAADLNISPAAITKWTQGHSMSVDHACNIADLLNISLDWFLMGRNGPDWLLPNHLNELELDLLGKLQERPVRIIKLLISLAREIPKMPIAGRSGEIQP